MKVYLAGKVALWGEPCWRQRIVGSNSIAMYDGDPNFFNPDHTVHITRGLYYGGPFLIDCGHGMYNGAHGADLRTSAMDQVKKKRLFEINNKRIIRSDFLFAYIDSFTAYGTFFEIGYAHANSIPVYICIDRNLDKHGDTNDLWYLVEAAQQTWQSSPEDAFDNFFSLKASIRLV